MYKNKINSILESVIDIKNIIQKGPIKTPNEQKRGNTTLFAGEPGTAFPFIFDHQAAMEIVTPRIITV